MAILGRDGVTDTGKAIYSPIGEEREEGAAEIRGFCENGTGKSVRKEQK